MEELIKKLIAEVGLTPEQAQKTVGTCVAFVKSKLPPMMSANVDAMFSGAQGVAKEETLTDKAADLAGTAKDKLEGLAHNAKDKLDSMLHGDTVEKAKDKLEDLAGDAKEKLDEFMNSELGEKAKGAFDKIKGMFGGSDEKKA